MFKSKKIIKEKILKIINPINFISEETVDIIMDFSQMEKISAKTIFISKGKQNSKEYFILNGICRSLLYSPKGEDITLSFYVENSIIPPCMTRTINGFSNQNFQALTDLTLVSISQNKFLELINKYEKLSVFANKSIENELTNKIEKEEFLIGLTAKEKLTEFRKKYKNLENLIPHNIIASYFGITNVSFSRIRKGTLKS